MDVIEWISVPHAASQSRVPRRFSSPAMIGMVGTLLIHATVIQSLNNATHMHQVRPPEILAPGSAGLNSKQDSAKNLVLIDLPSTVNSRNRVTVDVADTYILNRAALAIRIDPAPPMPTNAEALALDDQQGSEVTLNNTDAVERARLFGIYTGQIHARIDRIWRRPRSPVNEGEAHLDIADDSFQCQVQIVQDLAGNVQEILLPRCNGSQAWQRSLVVAIQQASPLPAPPSASVFNHSITLNFVGLSYVAGSSDDDYEIIPSTVARIQPISSTDRSTQSSIDQSLNQSTIDTRQESSYVAPK